MKKLVFLVFTIIILLNFNCEGASNQNRILGSWYLNNEFADTLILLRTKRGTDYSEWNFKDNGFLEVREYTSRRIEGNPPTIEIAYISQSFQWSLSETEDEFSLLALNDKNTSLFYSVQLLNNDELKLLNGVRHDQSKAEKISIKEVYYSARNREYATPFEIDTLTYSLSCRLSNNPRLELLADSTFCFYYNVKCKIETISDEQTQKLIKVVSEHADKIFGTWKSSKTDGTIILHTAKDEIVRYSLLNDKGNVFLIMQ